ncbi:hypothetical protein K8T06_11735 [bacterium]|nr:hypothetical protein [bacterium]
MKPILIILALLIVFSLPISASDLQVPSDYRSIQEAIDVAIEGDRILIAPGTHVGQGFRGISLLGKTITVQGTGPDTTIIDCEQLDRAFDFQYGESSGSIICDLAIINGLDGCGT